MNSQTVNESAEIDRKTSRSICDAVGERLQQELPPETSRPSSISSICSMNCADATRAAARRTRRTDFSLDLTGEAIFRP